MKVLVLGSGAVGTVSVLKFAQISKVEQLIVADFVASRAEALASRVNDSRVRAMALDASNGAELVRAIRDSGTTLLLNAALPATNLVVMRACLEAGCDYIDMASGGAADDGIPKLDDQFALDAEFRAAGRMALLGMGADPGTSNVYAAYAARHLLDRVTHLHIRDGDNSVCQGHDGFLAAFSPWVFIDECLCGAIAWRDGKFHLEPALSGYEPFNFPELGVLNTYYVDHEEARTLPRFIGGLEVADFKLCMDEVTWQTLKVMKQLGISRTDKVAVGGVEVAPRDVVVSLLPHPKDLAGRLHGKTCVGTLARGIKDGIERAYYLYNIADHDTVYREMGVQATAYQTGIPPVLAAVLMAEGPWFMPGVRSPEELNPDPFLQRLPEFGMAWHIRDEQTGVIDPVPHSLAGTALAA